MNYINQLIKNFKKEKCILHLKTIFGCRFKYAWVIPIKYKKGTSIVNAFKKIISEGQRKPNKIWVDQTSEFSNQSFKHFLKVNNIEMYSTYNEDKSAVAERFIMTTISKHVYIDVLNDIVNKYNNTVHRTIKIKPIDVTNDSYINIMKIQIKKVLNLKLMTI